jgi:RNA polymerase sigma-70 factor (ECF subfamily)
METAGPDEVAVLRQDLDAVARALAQLTDEQREAIELRFFAGLSAREAAEVMGKQEGTVRGLQFRAIAALRRSLGMELELEPDQGIVKPAAGLADQH